jgi:hypothetical protein
MTQPDQTPQSQPAALPEDLAALVRHMAIQQLQKSPLTRKTSLLWSGGFPMPGMGNDVAMEVTRELELRVRNRVTNEVFMQTEPVQFGPLVLPSKTIEEKFEAWCQMRGRDQSDPTSAPGGEQAPAEGNEA